MPTEPETHGPDAITDADAGDDAGAGDASTITNGDAPGGPGTWTAPAGNGATPPGAPPTPAPAHDGAPGGAGPFTPVPRPTEEPGARRRRNRGPIAAVVAMCLLVAFIVGATFVPLPYYLFKPGSVRDTEPLIDVSGAPTYASEGSIGYTTVSLRQATFLGLVQGWLDDDIDIYGRDQVLQGRNVDDNRQLNLLMMDNSKQVATQVALERLGYDVSVTIGEVVTRVLPGTPADGVLDENDVLVAVNGERFDDADDLTRILGGAGPGDTGHRHRPGDRRERARRRHHTGAVARRPRAGDHGRHAAGRRPRLRLPRRRGDRHRRCRRPLRRARLHPRHHGRPHARAS